LLAERARREFLWLSRLLSVAVVALVVVGRGPWRYSRVRV
jgi:hypothetical protein